MIWNGLDLLGMLWKLNELLKASPSNNPPILREEVSSDGYLDVGLRRNRMKAKILILTSLVRNIYLYIYFV